MRILKTIAGFSMTTRAVIISEKVYGIVKANKLFEKYS